MIRTQIESRGIKHQLTLDAIRKVERHLFVPARSRSRAYDDGPLPIGYGQTISQPFIVAYMTQLVDPKPGDKVLEIGAGSGYQAAVLAEIVGQVYTIEIVPELAKQAQTRMRELGYDNISLFFYSLPALVTAIVSRFIFSNPFSFSWMLFAFFIVKNITIKYHVGCHAGRAGARNTK